ncbi:MAG: adenylosuccinate lyase [Rhodobacteraceae bacterium]|nr:adenylosuccinate lyase [Paracoccaceae bacterium]
MKSGVIAAVFAVAATVSPALAGPDSCNHERQTQISCATGTVWDAATQRCLTVGS